MRVAGSYLSGGSSEKNTPKFRNFPLFMGLENRKCLVVGGGSLAVEKARLLLNYGAQVTIVCPEPGLDIGVLVENYPKCSIDAKAFDADDLRGMALVVGAITDFELGTIISDAAQAIPIPVNIADNKLLSTFSIPAIVDRGSIQVGISSGGASPSLVTRVKDQLEVSLPHTLGTLADLASKMRPLVTEILPDIESRREFWRNFFECDASHLFLSNHKGLERKEVATLVRQIMNHRYLAPSVSIVGAGPGDPDLLTVKALRKIQEADVVVYDRLVSSEILNRARKESKKIFVGKSKGLHNCGQDEINNILLREALSGRNIIRLKGGDPLIFGRGGEERAFLMAHGVEVDVIPGITAALGCGAASGIPMTHRDVTQAVTFITGHGDGELGLNWRALATLNHTLVVYMGIGAAAAISEKLIENGMASNVPVAVVANGTTLEQKLVVGKLETLSKLISQSDIVAPAIIVIGAVVEQSRLEVLRLANEAGQAKNKMIENDNILNKNKISEVAL